MLSAGKRCFEAITDGGVSDDSSYVSGVCL